MLERFDVASIEARILSLDATSITILGWLPYSRNDRDIIRRSGSWNYTSAIIERSLDRIYKVLDIDELTCALSKRQKAIDMYLAFKNAEYPLTAFSRRGKQNESAHSAKIFSHDDKEESDEMDTMGNLDSNRVGTLNDVQLKILKALSEGKDKYVISRDLRISVEQVVDEAPRIFNHLQIESSSLEQKRRTACELYEDYVAEHGEPTTTGGAAPTASTETKQPGEVNGHDHDLDNLARLIAGLSPRVKEVAGYLAEGRDLTDIAKVMGISESSVQPYVSNVYSKLGLHFSLGSAKRQGVLKLAHARFVSGSYEMSVPEESVEVKPSPASQAVVPAEFKGVNVGVIAQKLSKLTPRLLELAICLIRNKDPIKELHVAPSTLNSYKNSLFSQLGLTKRGLTRKERLKVLEFAHGKAFPAASSIATTKGTHSNGHALPFRENPESLRIPEQPAPRPSSEEISESAPVPSRTVEADEDISDETVQRYGQGVPIILSDPETIIDVAVISGQHREGIFDNEVNKKRQSGFHPEVLVVYPTANPTVSLAQLVLIKRKH